MRLRSLLVVAAVLAMASSAPEAFARGGGGGGRGGFGGGRGGNFGGRNFGGAGRGYGGGAGREGFNRAGQAGPQRATNNLFGNGNNAAIHNNWDHNANNWQNFHNYGGYGYGGYNGWGGYGGFGLGLGLGYGAGGGYYGGGYAGAGYSGAGYGNAYANGYANGTYNNTAAATNAYGSVAADAQQPAAAAAPASTDYVAAGESDFRAGRYQQAAADFRHALVDQPNNGGVLMMLGQTLFQLGDFHNAAGATEAAMGLLPEDKWGAGIENYARLYGNSQDYTNELKVLETARDKQPNDPALRFLLGFNFGYLGYPQHAVAELDKAVQLEARDPAARKLHDLFATKVGAPLVGPLNPQPAAPAVQSTRTPAAEVSIPGAVEN